jgi:hypothetical protein
MESSRDAEPDRDDRAVPTGSAADHPTDGPLTGVPDPPTLVAFINAQHGTTFRITDRYLGGEQGAIGLANAESTRFILKWRPGARDLDGLHEVIHVIDRLRSRWYPVTRYVVRGLHPSGAYVVQSALPGAPVRRLSPTQTEQIIALNDRQRGLATATVPAWPQRVVDDVLRGGDGYCRLDPMRRHAPTTARLLEIVQELVAQHSGVPTPTDDVVHFDFQPSNILTMPDRISGVVDWDGTCAGDRAFDLATLLFYVYDQDAPHDALWRRLAEITDSRGSAVYLAHVIHRQVDWSIRHHDDATVDRWLERARVVLHDLPARTGCNVPSWP